MPEGREIKSLPTLGSVSWRDANWLARTNLCAHSPLRDVWNATARLKEVRQRSRRYYFAMLQSGRIAPETPVNAPSTSSATRRRL